jgi:hypothetical protein
LQTPRWREPDSNLQFLDAGLRSYSCSSARSANFSRVRPDRQYAGGGGAAGAQGLSNAANWDGYVHGHYLPGIIRSLFFVRYQASGAVRFANGDWREVAFVLPIIDPILASVGTVADVMGPFLTLCERAIEHYPAERFVEQLLAVLRDQPGIPPGWRGTTLPGRIAALVHAFAERMQPLPRSLAEKMLRILDILVDMGDRRAAALQTSEIFKDVRPAGPLA